VRAFSAAVLALILCAMPACAQTVRRATPVIPQAAEPERGSTGVMLRPGDSFEMTISGLPKEVAEPPKQYTVGADGFVNITHAGLLKAAGLSLSQLEQAIQRKLIDEKIFRAPTVTINAGGAAVRFVTVGGQVRNPNRFQWSADLTLLAAVSGAGGVGEFGGDKVTLTRGGQSTLYRIKQLKKKPADDPRLLPGDLLEVL